MRTAAISFVFLLAGATPGADAPGSPRPIPPKQAPGKMTVPDGFKVTLFAGEPDIVQPIAFTFDDRGRMWVVECLSYPHWSKDGKGSDRVVILEDTNGDGTFDKKTVFMADGVNLSGIELGFGGVWLCSSPNLVFVPILDGDKPGKPEVVLDGWNMIDTKHNIFNSLTWGPDGWLYGCNGIQAKAWVGAPGTPKEKRAYLDCGVWKYHPTRKTFEVVAHGTTNPFGLDFDEHGELFITNCVIDHLFHFVPGGHYQRMYGQDANPYTFGLMTSCVDYKHWAGGDWTSSRSTGVGGDPKHSDFGGGHAHSGCAIYLGDNFPKEYRNTLFTCNIHGNRLNNDGLERTKSGMKGVRRPDFLFANDSWFRGICVKVGPEGALYVSDWSDTGECHNYDKCDTSNGRIYRVVYKDAKPFRGDVSKMTDAELVKLQLSSNEWLVRKARRVLQERAAGGKLEKGRLAPLAAMVHGGGENLRERLRALWALAATDALATSDLFPLLKDRDPSLRAWAFRFLLDANRMLDASQSQNLRNAIRGEESPFVRLHIAGAAASRTWGFSDINVAVSIASWEEENAHVLHVMWYAIEAVTRGKPEDSLHILLKQGDSRLRRNAVRYIIARSDDLPKTLDRLLGLIGPGTARPVPVKTDIVSAVRDSLTGRKNVPMPRGWPLVFGEIKKQTTPDGPRTHLLREAESLAVIFGDKDAIAALMKRIADPSAKAEDRRGAVELLAPRKLPDFARTLQGLLNDEALRGTAIRALAGYSDANTPAAILAVYPKLTPQEKADAVQTLASRVSYAKALLDAIEKGTIPRADVPVTAARQILALNDKATSARLETVWGKITPASKERAALIKKWKGVLTEDSLKTADPARGRVLFTKHCSACHKMFGEGQAVGPELTGSQRANLDYVLENVLDPSAVVPREFKMVNFTTVDDRVVSGIVLRETKDAVTVRTTNDQVILPVADIAARKPTNLSIMPEGLLDQMKPDEVRDLVAYLRAKQQVPIPK